ncbi:hypothetical protein G7046_g7452 [Stylonectria norvegica]|nr:hypothetical protein G7046_g7452 [Stylonectria norvegica]
MRRSAREEWTCTGELPKAHNRDIYSVAWSGDSGLVASTGSDGILALYKEDEQAPQEKDDHPMVNGGQAANGTAPSSSLSSAWKLIATQENAHGPYEVNHVTWCRRFDAGSERRGEEEMLVTTGDDGTVRPWKVDVPI